jgi:hypothetical protein
VRIIDANTGTEVKVGQTFRNVDGTQTLMRVEEGLFSARALFTRRGQSFWSPLVVRFMHPGFMFQKIGFIPS